MKKILLGSFLLFMATGLLAQSRESADQVRNSLQAGAEFSAFNPDFYCTNGSSPFSCGIYPLMKGVGAFGDFNVRDRYGAEAEARWLRWDNVAGQVESTYLIGPRIRAYRWRRLEFWGKFLIGVGNITTANYPAPDTLKGTMLAYAPGATLDYRLNRRFAARVDYEYQMWPTFAALPPNTNGLAPNGFSFGVVYTIFTH